MQTDVPGYTEIISSNTGEMLPQKASAREASSVPQRVRVSKAVLVRLT